MNADDGLTPARRRSMARAFCRRYACPEIADADFTRPVEDGAILEPGKEPVPVFRYWSKDGTEGTLVPDYFRTDQSRTS
jgi:hypothetical protein